MRKIAFLIAMLFCVSLTGSGQSDGQPQWKVVKTVLLKAQTQTVPLTVLFTVNEDALYRVSTYQAVTTNEPQSTWWNFWTAWSDRSGYGGGTGSLLALDNGGIADSPPSIMFSPKIGTTVTFEVSASDPTPENATYDVAVTIERLTH